MISPEEKATLCTSPLCYRMPIAQTVSYGQLCIAHVMMLAEGGDPGCGCHSCARRATELHDAVAEPTAFKGIALAPEQTGGVVAIGRESVAALDALMGTVQQKLDALKKGAP